MRKIIKKTINNSGEKCKTYVIDYKNSIIFYKYTLIPNKDFSPLIGGEVVVKETNNYILTFHQFSIKKQTLGESLSELRIID